jgi:hypothetical protein
LLWGSEVVNRRVRKGVFVAAGVYLASSVALAAWLMPAGREASPVDFAAPRDRPVWGGGRTRPTLRQLALQQAGVWTPSSPAAADFTANPGDPSALLSQAIVRCRYFDGPVRGTTPKFDCALPDGEVVKVKYGRNAELHAELAATRLLAALGFGADRIYLVPRLRCYGCVRTPFHTLRLLDYVHAREAVQRRVPDDSYSDFEWVAVERRLEGYEIEADDEDGWPWYELEPIDSARGANRAERDALRLVAMLLAHWDNKASNQRLLCLAPAPDGDGSCPRPFAYIQDVGATFGPRKVDFERWHGTPVWADRTRCLVSMRQFPYSGGTFPDTRISEAGRQLAARLLSPLGERRLAALFTAARFPEFNGAGGEDGDPSKWARTLLEKARQIAAAGPCPE